jgi:hypothetical protein
MLGDNSINRIVSNSLDNNYLIYGWNGSSWQLDNAELLEGKPTHSSTDTLIDNLNIRWEELSPESPYSMSIGEHFTQYINKGILKEDYITNPKYSFYFIMRPTIFYDINITIPSGLTYQLPFVTDDINFWAIATDTTETFRLHDLEISGYGEPIDIINIGSTAPAQGTITLNSSTGGVLTFNALDEGKTLTGKILYTQKFHPTEVRV